ncbi:hypothetical protein M5K25_002328 [Dendrobium thyrsiflorum]|uniref:Uncharacterized protein n=1 Tax=Dendrobium thyrsiflorum TaxID=117978 RepID=A0ABD0VU96_DENTH
MGIEGPCKAKFGSVTMANASFRRSDPSFLNYKNTSKSFKEVLFGSDTLNDFPDLKVTTLQGLPIF